MTHFMRKWDLFDSKKFVGVTLKFRGQEPKSFPWISDERYLLVAKVFDNAYFIHPMYEDTRISDGNQFCLLKKYCESLLGEEEPNG